MSYDINNKTSDIKESRSLSLNSIIALEGNIVASKAKDDFNNSYLFNPTFNINDTNYYPAVQDLISLYMMEFNLENGTTFTHPTLENYNKTGWEAIMVNALKDTGDGHFYPLIPGADVAAAFEEAGVSPGEMAETMAGLAGHLENDGTDHSFIGQDVKSSASPTFVKLTLTDAVDAQAIYVNGARKDLLWDSAIGGSHPPNNPGQLPPSELTGGDVLSQINTNEYGHVTGYKKRTLTADNINAAAKNQTMYIGTTAVAINRPTGALTLSGVSLSSLTFKSDGTGADPNTVYNGSAARNISWNTIGAASSNHVHTGTYAPINQIMYIGSTQVAINRPSADLALTGVSLSSLTFNSIRFSGGTYTGKSAVTVDLKEGHGDSVNPYASKDQGLFLATPVSGSGKPIFRGINKNDIPILNQSTTGQAGSVANSITFNNGGIGASSGTTFNGSEARTISWNTIGAASSNHNHNYAGSSTPGGAANSVANALTKGDGLSFGTASSYNGSAAVTITLGTPSPISTTSGDNVTSTSHTHSIVTTATGATNTVVKTDASGNIRAANTFEFGANAYIQYNSTAKSLQFGFV